MPHPAVLFCQIATARASAQCATVDGRLARSESEFIQTMRMSREAVARSRDVLAGFEPSVRKSLALRPAAKFSDMTVATLKSVIGGCFP